MHVKNGFTIRVYGIFVDAHQRVLLSDECVNDFYFTKFPGGGLEWGEGTRDCLLREMREELETEIRIEDHFYTTDFFVPSKFDPTTQVMSIYYQAAFPKAPDHRISEVPFDFDRTMRKAESFRWVSLESLAPSDLTFPIDQHVLQKIQERFLP